ncbi:MAG: hypothetical protein EOP43_02560 [Sphingobacteriaceae bacterium]|nr:MAG: hypothetical protein EOP43_02560 [Sphingobacteriaceae bacterium]
MKKTILTRNYFNRKHGLYTAILCGCIVLTKQVNAQTNPPYKAPQDTVKTKLPQNANLTTTDSTTQSYTPDSRFVGAAVKAAEMLADTTKYDAKKGIAIQQLFSADDLQYVAKQGTNGVVVLFDLVNKRLPKGLSIAFRAENQAVVTTGKNPLVLKNLRAFVAANPASIQGNNEQWKENVYQAYMARDYATKLNNTITITSATREIRETPELVIIDFNGNPISLAKILANKQAKTSNKLQAEKEAVAEFREHTFPVSKISKANANENYRRALFALITLQEGDINRHPETKKFVDALTNDLQKGRNSNVVTALKNNNFYDANVPGNLGPVLLTEDAVINADKIQTNPRDKAMEILTLTALHYGERDAIKLLKSLVNGKGSIPAQQTTEFTPKRLGQLTNHGTEQLKSLGFGTAKTNSMSNSDLVLLAVAAPDAPMVVTPKAFLTLQQVGASIANYYYSTSEISETKNVVLFNPRISFGSRHTEYRAAFDAVDFVPEFLNGVYTNQKGSRVVQNGLELRIESDIYFSNPQTIIEKAVKPVIFPEFGILAGAGRRSVGYDNSTTPGPLGAVPQFRNTYINWGGHFGLNVGPFLLATDATYFTSQTSDNPYERFFDLSQGMTYYRYTLLGHFINFGLGKIEEGKGTHFTLDAEYTGETNNTGIRNRTVSAGNAVQTGNGEWQRDYNRVRPNGVYNLAIANSMIVNGDVKATYASSSYAAIRAGLQKASLQLTAMGGLYNLYTVPINGGRLISAETFKNTFNGNLFGSLTLTYHFGSNSFITNSKKTETYQNIGGVESEHKVDETSTEKKAAFGPRNHSIFLNKKARLKPVAIEQ